MLDRYAEPERSDTLWITGLSPEFLDDPPRPDVVGGEDVRQSGRGRSQRRASTALRSGPCRRGCRSTRTARDTAGRSRPTRGARRRSVRRSSEGRRGRRRARAWRSAQAARAAATRSRSVWYDGAAAWWNSSTITTSKCAGSSDSSPDRLRLWIDAKTCSNRGGTPSADPKLTEARVTEGVRERRAALLEDLLPVRDEQQPVTRQPFAKARVVDRRHDRLARAGCGDEEVPVPPVRARELDLLEQPLLKRHRGRSRSGCSRSVCLRLPSAPCARGTRSRSYGTKSPLSQYDVEDGGHLRDDVGVANAGDSNVPLEPGDQRRVRQVGRSDVRGRVAALPMEQPRLRVQPCRRGVVGDLDLGSERRQLVERTQLRAVRVRRRNDAQRLSVPAMPTKCVRAEAGCRSTARTP